MERRCCHIFLWLLLCPWLISVMKDTFLVYIIVILIADCWRNIIIGTYSLYMDEEKTVECSCSRGCKNCLMAFVITELLLFAIGVFWSSKVTWLKGICHFTSVYYLILGVANVFFRDLFKFNVMCKRVKDKIFDYSKSIRYQKDWYFICDPIWRCSYQDKNGFRIHFERIGFVPCTSLAVHFSKPHPVRWVRPICDSRYGFRSVGAVYQREEQVP